MSTCGSRPQPRGGAQLNTRVFTTQAIRMTMVAPSKIGFGQRKMGPLQSSNASVGFVQPCRETTSNQTLTDSYCLSKQINVSLFMTSKVLLNVQFAFLFDPTPNIYAQCGWFCAICEFSHALLSSCSQLYAQCLRIGSHKTVPGVKVPPKVCTSRYK